MNEEIRIKCPNCDGVGFFKAGSMADMYTEDCYLCKGQKTVTEEVANDYEFEIYLEQKYAEAVHWGDSIYGDCCSHKYKSGSYCSDTAVSGCEECGDPLCVMHSEVGAGFCQNCPTENYDPYRELKAEANSGREWVL